LIGKASPVPREEISFEDIIFSTECGGSDACSCISSNPALGYVSEKIVDHGATVILAEITELIGAEHLLAERSVDDTVRQRVVQFINLMEQSIYV